MISCLLRDSESEPYGDKPYGDNGGTWTNYQDTAQYRMKQNPGKLTL